VPAGTIENRPAPRVDASRLPFLTSLRFSPYGSDAALVNISRTGLLAQCGVRLKPSDAVTVVFDSGFSPPSAEGHVVRCAVASMGADGKLQYHIAIAFTDPIELPHDAATPPVQAVTPVPDVPIIRNRW
jgi:hypothetical protein